MDQEQELRRNLADLHREYCECAEPIIQELVKMENRKIPAPFIGPAAVRSLRMISTKEAFEALHNGESDPDYYVRRESALALERIQELGIASDN